MTSNEYLSLYDRPLTELIALADSARQSGVGEDIDLCTIINARSGRCTEDCKFCAQSAHYVTGAAEYPLLPDEEMLQAAAQAKAIGSARFSIVTSGNALDDDEFARVVALVTRIGKEVGIAVCASLGCLSREQLTRLRDAGISRYHHNLETSRNFYPHIVSTHGYDERLDTARTTREVGIPLCCGGIFGLGESRKDRIELALELRALQPDVVPLNFLIAIPGTPLADMPPLDPVEALKTIAIFRLILPDKVIKLGGGREQILGDFQATAFLAGANGMIIGGYLTRAGRAVEEDRRLVEGVRAAWKR